MKTAFIFTGQGAQTPGMGRELYNNYNCVRETYNSASFVLGRDIADISFNATPEELNRTVNSQPAIFTLSMSAYALLRENSINCDAVAGFSLGECTAVCAAGMLNLAEALELIMLRGEVMQTAADATDGAMYAIIGTDINTVEQICKKTEGFVTPVNYNCPGQTVIAGNANAAAKAAEVLKDAGAIKVVKLNVAGAFHTKLMQSASDVFVKALEKYDFKPPVVDFYSDVTGTKLINFSNMPQYLGQQMVNPVKWQSIIENMLTNGIDTFIELGSGRVLSGLIKRISRTATVYNVEDVSSLNRLLEAIK